MYARLLLDEPAQTVSVRFTNGVLANFKMRSALYQSMRSVRVDGTRGSAWGELHSLDGWIRVDDHKSGRVRGERVPTAYDGQGVLSDRNRDQPLGAAKGSG